MEDYNNSYENNYNPVNQVYDTPENQKPIWAALVSFILSIANIFTCCCTSFISVPLSLIFGIVSLAKKWRGKGLAITGVVISTITLIYMIVSQVMFGEMSRDISYIIINSGQYAEEYERTGEIPDEFEKYTSPEYDRYWEMLGFDDFKDFLDYVMDVYNSADNGFNNSENEIDDDDFYNDDDSGFDYHHDEDYGHGENPIDI